MNNKVNFIPFLCQITFLSTKYIYHVLQNSILSIVVLLQVPVYNFNLDGLNYGMLALLGMLLSSVEPHLTVTSLVRKPPHYSHPGSVPNCIPQCK